MHIVLLLYRCCETNTLNQTQQKLKTKRGISTMCLRHIVLSLYILFDLLNNIICVMDLAIDEMVKVKQTLVISFRMCAVCGLPGVVW